MLYASSIDWSNLTVAAAFILGAILATIATLRLFRIVSEYYAGIDRRRGKPDQ